MLKLINVGILTNELDLWVSWIDLSMLINVGILTNELDLWVSWIDLSMLINAGIFNWWIGFNSFLY